MIIFAFHMFHLEKNFAITDLAADQIITSTYVNKNCSLLRSITVKSFHDFDKNLVFLLFFGQKSPGQLVVFFHKSSWFLKFGFGNPGPDRYRKKVILQFPSSYNVLLIHRNRKDTMYYKSVTALT